MIGRIGLTWFLLVVTGWLASSASAATLVAQYHMDESSWNGTTGELLDTAGYSGGPYNGRATGSSSHYPIPLGSFPALGDSISGSCGYASCPGGTSGGAFQISGLPLSSSSNTSNSVSFWMNWNGSNSQSPLAWQGYRLYFYNSYFGVSTGVSDVYGVSSSGLANGWHHVAVVLVNGNVSSSKIYIDGVLKSPSQSGSPSNDSQNTQVSSTLYIGGYSSSTRFSGLLDEVNVFTGAIDQTQVSTLYTQTHTCRVSGCAANGTSPISFVAASNADTSSNSTVNALRFTPPSATASGNVMLVEISTYRTSTSCTNVTPPSGWTLAVSNTKSASKRCLGQAVYWKVAGSSENSAYTFNFSSSVYATGSIASYKGADANAPVMTAAGQGNNSSGSITAPSVPTIRDGAMLVGYFGMRGNQGSIAPPACMTERAESAVGGASSGVRAEMADSPWGTAGATGTRTASSSYSAYNIGQIVVLQPPETAATPSDFNVFETSAAASALDGVIHTKVAGSAFSLAVVALNSNHNALYTSGGGGFVGSLKVELLGTMATNPGLDANGCQIGAVPLTSSTLIMSAGDNSRKNLTFPTVANAWRNVRVRISYPATGTATQVACSTDKFAIRPDKLANLQLTDADWSNAGNARTLNNNLAIGGVVHRAGQPFSMASVAHNSVGDTTNQYNTLPVVEARSCLLPAGCAAGSLDPGDWNNASGVLTSTSATYDEVGVLSIRLKDTSFALVDVSDGTPADCSASGSYVCSDEITVGRFVPDSFNLVVNNSTTNPDGASNAPPSFLTFNDASLPNRSFTYVGQDFGYATFPQALVSALNANGDPTVNYSGELWKLNAASVLQNYTSMPASPVLDVWAPGTPSVTSNGDGTGLVDVTLSKLRFTRAAPIAPFTPEITLTLDLHDDSEKVVAGNGTISTSTQATFSPIPFDAGGEFRYGRLKLDNALGSELLPLAMPAKVEYWNGSTFVPNTADAFTSLPAPTLTASADHTLTASDVTASYGHDPVAAGDAALNLNNAAHKAGSIDVGVNLDTKPWLKYNWDGIDQGNDGNLYDDDPHAHATFGKRGTRQGVIYRREVY